MESLDLNAVRFVGYGSCFGLFGSRFDDAVKGEVGIDAFGNAKCSDDEDKSQQKIASVGSGLMFHCLYAEGWVTFKSTQK